MSSLPPEELLPVLVADLADDDARDVLDAAAFTGGKIWVPLETAPISAAEHLLEVHTPSAAEPIFYLAEPLGPPNEDGFPLRVKAMPDAPKRTRPVAPVTQGVVRPRRSTTTNAPTLSASHTKDLSHVGPAPAEENVDSLLGHALAGGKLVIEQLIGQGGVGAVYKARHRELRMPVAVKVLRESFQRDLEFCKRFYAEALAASRLDHPNITRVIDFGQEPDGQLYFAMEYLDGVELRSVMEAERTLSAPRIVQVMMQVCAGLSHAHARGIVHRDIKPENLVLVPGQDDDGKPIQIVKVCDFGIAQHRALPITNQTEGFISGTPEYMSPEQCRGDDLDARSDVYACGVILYELATGQVPFTSERPESILNKQQFTPPLPPSKINPNVDPLLEKIILKALQKERDDRQKSMRELRAELRELLDPILVEASPPPASVEAPPASVRGGVVAPPPPPPDQPAWLERGPVYAPTPSPDSRRGTSGQHLAVDPASAGDEMADALAMNAQAWLQRIAQITDRRQFAHALTKVEPAFRVLASRGDVRALWTVSSTLHGMAMHGTQAVGSRAWSAAQVLRVFEDPSILTQVAEQLLVGPEESRDQARRLLVHAGVAGAYGLYGARVKLAQDPNVRPAFVNALKDFGPKAWPVVRASLEKIINATDPNSATFELAEDLLLCVPLVGDESAGHVVVKYLRVNVSGVCRAATAAILKLWSDRAKPLLVGMLQSKDDVVRIAGIAGLRQLNAIDEHIVPRLHGILTRRIPAGEELRAAAAVALAHASPTARQPAESLLAQLLTPARGAPPERPEIGAPAGALSKEDAVIIAIARSLLTLGGKAYRGLVAERAERSTEPLRSQLRRLLTT